MPRRLLFSLLLAVWTLCLLTVRSARADAPLRINCGSPVMVGTFRSDAYYNGSAPISTTTSIDLKAAANAAPMAVYQTQNTATTLLAYNMPGFTPSAAYTVRLHFAELVYNAANSRTMNIAINGAAVLNNFDIWATAGAKNRAVVKSFNAVASSSGYILVTFVPVIGSSAVNGIEIVPRPILSNDHPLPGWAAGVTPMNGGGTGGMGPSSADGVNLASGVYENDPGADIGARNPVGPSPVFARLYRSSNAFSGYASPGLTAGWTHNYDVVVQANLGKSGPLTLRYPNGAAEQWGLGPRITSGTARLVPPAGTPYMVTGVAAATGATFAWQSLTITFSDESRWTFTPSSASTYRLTQISNLVGRSILLSYDGLNRLASITDDAHLLNPNVAANFLLYFAYNGGPAGKLNTVSEYSDPANGRQVAYSYTSSAGTQYLAGVSQIAPYGAISTPLQWQYQGQPLLNRVGVPDPTGPSGLFQNNIIYYDANGRVQQIADANNNVQMYIYGANTQVQTVNTGNVADVGTQLFDSLNRDLGGIDALNHQAATFYDDPSNPYQPTRMVNRNQQTTLFNYEPTYGNLLTADVPSNGGRLTASYNYDYTSFAMGRLSSVQVGGKTPTSVMYYTNNTVVNNIPQANGLVRQVTSPAPNGAGTVVTTYVYTALGNALQITLPGPNGQVTYSYNYTQDGNYTRPEALGEPLTISDPLRHVTHFRYDARGNLAAMMDAIGRETDYVYNAADQPVQVIYPPKGVTSPGRSYIVYNYLYLGGPLQQTLFYDESGTLVRSVLRTAGKEDETKAQTGSVEKATLTYDPSYRVKTLSDGNGHAFGHQYDLNGNLKQFTYPLANTRYQGFDTSSAGYDNDDNVKQVTDGKNQIFNLSLALDDSRLTDILYPANTLGTTHYDYDQYGRVVSRMDNAGTYTFQYDDLDNLLSTTTTYKKIRAAI